MLSAVHHHVRSRWGQCSPREKWFLSLVVLVGLVLIGWSLFGGVPDECHEFLASMEIELNSQRPDNSSTFNRLYDQFERVRTVVGRMQELDTSSCPCSVSTIQSFSDKTMVTVSDIAKRQRAALQQAFDDECPSVGSRNLTWKQVEEAFEKYSKLYDAFAWKSSESAFPKALIPEVDKCVTLARTFSDSTMEVSKVAALSEILRKHANQPYDHDLKIRQALIDISGEKSPAFQEFVKELRDIWDAPARYEERIDQIKQHALKGVQLFKDDRENRGRIQTIVSLASWLIGGDHRDYSRSLRVSLDLRDMAEFKKIHLIVKVNNQEPTSIKEFRPGVDCTKETLKDVLLPAFKWRPGESIEFRVDVSKMNVEGDFYNLGAITSPASNGLEILALDFDGELRDTCKCKLTFNPPVDSRPMVYFVRQSAE